VRCVYLLRYVYYLAQKISNYFNQLSKHFHILLACLILSRVCWPRAFDSSMFRCKTTTCLFETHSPQGYMNHCRVHSNLSTFVCGVETCNQTFRSQSAFHCHVSRCHGLLRSRKKQTYLQNVGTVVKCSVVGCNNLCPFDDIVKHLKGHIDAGITVHCPVQGCGRPMSKKSTLTAHISVKHGNVNKMNINEAMTEVDENSVCTTELNVDTTDLSDSTEPELPDTSGQHVDTADTIVSYDNTYVETYDGINKNAFMQNLSLFFLRLQCRFNVPVSTIEVIARELQCLHALSMENCLKVLTTKLVKENIQPRQLKILCATCKKMILCLLH
jgi:hypothetical protein